MKYLKTYESKFTESDKFKQWFIGSKIINEDGTPKIVYHGTNKIFRRFSMKAATMGGIIWFTTNKESIEKGEVGASGHGVIKNIYISMKNPANWDEYEKYTLGQLEDLGYDGVILSDGKGNYDGFVFHSNQIRIAK
jgi:hypothetical protein